MLNGTVEGHLNVPLFYETLRRLINENFPDIKLTVTVSRKENIPENKAEKEQISAAQG